MADIDLSFIDEKLPTDDFSVRSQNCFKEEYPPITTWRDLATKSENEMLRISNFGRRSLNECREILVSKGLKFGMSELPPLAITPEIELTVSEDTEAEQVEEATPPPRQEKIVEVTYNVIDAGFEEAINSFKNPYLCGHGSTVTFTIKVEDLVGLGGVFVATVNVADFVLYLAASLERMETPLNVTVHLKIFGSQVMDGVLISNPRGKGSLVVHCPVLGPEITPP